MRTLMTLTGTLALFALALAFGWAQTAAASPALDTGDAIQDTAPIELRADDGQTDHRRARRACQRLARAVHRACPCQGPDGPEGEPWKNHGEFVSCVNQKINEVLAAHPDADLGTCATRLRERAAQSDVGKPGFECPTRGDRPGRGERPDPGVTP